MVKRAANTWKPRWHQIQMPLVRAQSTLVNTGRPEGEDPWYGVEVCAAVLTRWRRLRPFVSCIYWTPFRLVSTAACQFTAVVTRDSAIRTEKMSHTPSPYKPVDLPRGWRRLLVACYLAAKRKKQHKHTPNFLSQGRWDWLLSKKVTAF